LKRAGDDGRGLEGWAASPEKSDFLLDKLNAVQKCMTRIFFLKKKASIGVFWITLYPWILVDYFVPLVNPMVKCYWVRLKLNPVLAEHCCAETKLRGPVLSPVLEPGTVGKP